ILIIALVAFTFISNPSAGWQQTMSWVLWNGSLSAIGTIIAFGHPLAVLTALVAAPITSLNPLLASGWFAGLVLGSVRRAEVSDFESLSKEVYSVKGSWNSHVTRLVLIVVLANLGGARGTFVGAAEVIRLFFENL